MRNFPPMYHRILQLLIGLLIFSTACRQEPGNNCEQKLLDRSPEATALLTQDTIEGYFEIVTSYDIQLQMGERSDTAITLEQYLNWLPGLVLDWPQKHRERGDRLLRQAVTKVEKLCPNLLPETIYLVLLNDKPYGPNIYFTRNAAIFVPLNDLANASDRDLENVLIHELFHLVSRQHRQWREALYAIANFVPAATSMSFDSLKIQPLANPDAPNSNYWFLRNDDYYVPLLYANNTGKDFATSLDYGVHKVAVYKEKKIAYATERALWIHQIVESTEANTNYLIHPEEILADHFTLLVNEEKKGVLFPEELEDLRLLLQRMEE